MTDTHDVVIIGAGPAGSTAAGLLAKRDHRVLMIDRDTFPRPHVGESLLPAELPIFDELGFEPGGDAIHKSGADFLDESSGEFGRFDFGDALDPPADHAFQIDRGTFDHRLAEHARTLGATVRFGQAATAMRVEDDGAWVDLDGAPSVRTRFVVDATGFDRLLCKQHKSFERIDGLGVAAVWGQFDELSDAAVDELAITGNITILILTRGWGWIIPLPGGRLSTGFVSCDRGVVSEAWFEEQYAASPMLKRLTRGAHRGELQRIGDYSFKNTRPRGARFGCIGDASAFLDPVFSSGVAFAMSGAHQLVELLDPALREGTEHEPDLLAPLEAKMQIAYDVFGAMIRSFYHTRMVKNLFFYDDPDMEIRAGLISVLAGDVWRDDNKFQSMLLRSSRRMQQGL